MEALDRICLEVSNERVWGLPRTNPLSAVASSKPACPFRKEHERMGLPASIDENPQLDPLLKRLYEAIRASASIDLQPFPEEDSEEEF